MILSCSATSVKGSDSVRWAGNDISWDQDPLYVAENSRGNSSGSGLAELLSDPSYRSKTYDQQQDEDERSRINARRNDLLSTPNNNEPDPILAKFQNAKSISSADFDFGSQVS